MTRNPWDSQYYGRRAAGVRRSADAILEHLWSFYSPHSVVDIGCGDGSWLRAAGALGAQVLWGVEGSWHGAESFRQDEITLITTDLNLPFHLDRTFDLAMSLEVAEHLEPPAGDRLVEVLTKAAPVVLFSAAQPFQGGIGHINELPASYWASLFREHEYVCLDLFRPTHWGLDHVDAWYAQNTFLYVSATHLSDIFDDSSIAATSVPLPFMDCIHPSIMMNALANHTGFRYHCRDLLPSAFRALKRRINRP